MHNETSRIADTVRGAVAEHRLTQNDIAELLGLSRSSVYQRLSGRRPFTAAELLILAHSMRVPVSRLYPAERAA